MRDQNELSPTEPDTGRHLFLLSFGCDSGGYYRVGHGMELNPKRISNSVPLPDTQWPALGAPPAPPPTMRIEDAT